VTVVLSVDDLSGHRVDGQDPQSRRARPAGLLEVDSGAWILMVPSGFAVNLSTPRSAVSKEPNSLEKVCAMLGWPTNRVGFPSWSKYSLPVKWPFVVTKKSNPQASVKNGSSSVTLPSNRTFSTTSGLVAARGRGEDEGGDGGQNCELASHSVTLRGPSQRRKPGPGASDENTAPPPVCDR
jgi:hypothetical protein